MVHRELHDGERRVVARDLEAVHCSDRHNTLPVVLEHRRVLGRVALVEEHQRRESTTSEDHVRSGHDEGEAQPVQAERPSVKQVEQAVQSEVPATQSRGQKPRGAIALSCSEGCEAACVHKDDEYGEHPLLRRHRHGGRQGDAASAPPRVSCSAPRRSQLAPLRAKVDAVVRGYSPITA